ncbi:lysoplasmalogenase [Rhodococcus sp. BP-252]|uniref:lysoplasmalogenase n=1 Tax=unclassified Rhodococcus (in: high G+C Gram-positive bacteria) TaxID=192944 RepID=UPI001C9AFBF5|nr:MULTISPECIES: lysoplasmalogenase [unclassified Rhodococcus (in: high G+C Gram-positive bacteria)]MBY6412583.1 lysoplasmalogenase [Rhodococcus sp. BP-320]MBY6417162.1 lysoplasmalogenase [Rhodococcus sp. BP-321]MBY6424533.1 lysoplasmalogenase [Rhodococcus sp. BP-324]MBY6427186.1 lysoplasmalogenase [Rhodococcus sp. BP-323]MBY6432201.1 lysoplasmalogenase [Rhodococcus sp. BP-322]
MKRTSVARIFFAGSAAATVIGAATGRERVHRVAKPLMMPALAASVERRSALLGSALAAATLGDVLMLDPDDDARILGGAGAFAVMQTCYSVLLASRGARITTTAALPRLAGWGVAAVALRQRSPDVAPGLAGYGVLLATMSTLSADPTLAPGATVRAGVVVPTGDTRSWLAAGGVLFTISDALIVFRRLVLSSERVRRIAEGAVLSTYALAQYLLVRGLAGE